MDSETDGQAGQGISSLMDTWIRLRMFEDGNECNRGLLVVKSRGMAHSNQIREYLITDQGLKLEDVYLGQTGGLLMGSTRAAMEVREKAGALAQKQESERRKRELEKRLRSLDVQIAALRSEFEMDEYELNKLIGEEDLKREVTDKSRMDMARLKRADSLLKGS